MWFLFLIIILLFVRQTIARNTLPIPIKFKTKDEIEEMLFHGPAQKAIWECRSAGVSEDSIQIAINHHKKMRRRRKTA